MRIDLPCCGFKNCRYCFDGNCTKPSEQGKCEYWYILHEESEVIARKGIFIPDITVEMFRNASLEAVEELLVSGEMQDIILPSAEPERLTDDDFETIRIHLNAQKEKLCNQQRWKEAEEYQRIIDRFMAFASAQPDSPPTCNNLATDLISRQAAIDAVNKIAPVNTEYDCTLLDILDVRYVLTELPPAEPFRPKEE